MKKITIILMILALVSKFLGFFREIAISYYYGTSFISDAYFISLTIPGTLFAFIGVGISTIFIPMYNKVITEEGKQFGDKFTNNVLNLFFLISTLIILFTFIFTSTIVQIFASGFEGETLELGIYFTRITIISLYFFSAIYVYGAYLKSNNSFIFPALVGIPFNIVVIISIVVSTFISIDILAIGNLFASGLQFVLLLWFVRKKKLKYKFKLNFNDKYIKKMIILSLPVILGVSVNQLNKIVDQTLASRIMEGGVSAIHFASRLDAFIIGIIVMSIATVLYSSISKMAAENNINGLKKALSNSITSIIILLVPTTVITMIFADSIVNFVFGRGAFDAEAISFTSSALYFYAIGMVFVGIREVLARAFYSMQDTKTPMRNAAIGVTVNIIFSIFLSSKFGLSGLAFATSLSAVITTFLLLLSLTKKIGSINLIYINIVFWKVLISSLSMGLIGKLIFGNMLHNQINSIVALIISVLVSIIFYIIFLFTCKIEEIDSYKTIIIKKIVKAYKKIF